MEFQELKTGPFGYRKEDVYRYVNEQNSRYELLAKEKEELQKALDQSRSAEKQLKEAQERADALQKECDGLRAQAEDLRQQLAKSEEDSGSLRDARESISTAILHAEKYASAVRRQADYVCAARGGEGAVREVLDLLFDSKKAASAPAAT